MFMVMFVLDDPERLNEVLEVWEKAGIKGVTILESTGLHRIRRQFIPMRYVSAFVDREESHLTLITIVDTEQKIQNCLKATEEVIGDLDQPHTGMFAAWPLQFVKGTSKETL